LTTLFWSMLTIERGVEQELHLVAEKGGVIGHGEHIARQRPVTGAGVLSDVVLPLCCTNRAGA